MHETKRKKLHLLLVEDSLGDAKLLLELFKNIEVKADVTLAKDGKEALSYLQGEANQQNPSDLIILDLKLPGMSGHDILKRIKSDLSLRSTPVIVLSSSSDESDITKSYDLQASCYITKPNDLSRYEEAVDAIERFWFNLAKLPAQDNSESCIDNM